MTSNSKTFVLGVGAQKCGTTWLYNYLRSFPNIDMGFAKEYHIWDAIYTPECHGFRVSFPDSLKSMPARIIRSMQMNEGEYFEYFKHLLDSGRADITADITPSYSSLSALVLANIYLGFTDHGYRCKAIFLMRDPLERCWSAVRMHRHNAAGRSTPLHGVRADIPEEDALLDYIHTPEAQIRTRYDRTIAELEKAFPVKDIYYGIYEELFTEQGIADISRFIGVEPKPDFQRHQFNVSPKQVDLSAETMQSVVHNYRQVYEACAERFPQTRNLWRGHVFL